MICPRCSNEIQDGSKACPICGCSFVESVQAPPAKKKPIFKKWWFWLLIVAVIIVLAAAFSGGGDSSQTTAAQAKVDVITDTTAAEATAQVVYDKDGIKVTYKGSKTDLFNVGYYFLVENETNRDINISVDTVDIDGYTCSTLFYVSTGAGKKANESMTVLTSDLEDNGIEADSIGSIEFSFHIYDSKTYDVIDDSDTIVLSF